MVGNMNQKRLGYIYLVITFIIWGSIYVVAKYALAVIPPLTVLLGRYALSVLILYVILKKKGMKKIERADRKYFVIIGGVGYFVSIGFQLIGTNLLDASLASLINALNPVFIPLIAALVLKERVSLRRIAGIAVSVAGVYAILGVGGGELSLAGIAASICSVTFWSVSSVMVRKVAGKYDPIQIAFVGMAIALCFNIPASIWELCTTPCRFTLPAVLSLIYLAVICTALAHTLWNKSLQLLSAGTCSMLYPLQPLTSAVLGVLLLHEQITTGFVIGAVVISAGILIAVKE